MESMKILKQDVIATRIQFDPYTGFCWEIDGVKYGKGFNCASCTTDGERFSFDYMPMGLKFKGNVTQTQDVYGVKIGFCPHSNQVTRQQIEQWYNEHWIKCFGNDDHLFKDIEFVTYKDPKSKSGKLRIDKVSGFLIQHQIHVYVFRKNGDRNIMSIPIELIVARYPYTYDESGSRIIREKLKKQKL